MTEPKGRGLGWLEPALEVLSRRYFGRVAADADWGVECWMRATGAALAERLGPALAEACAVAGVSVPKQCRAVLAVARLENERRTEEQEQELAELGPAFQEAGIRPILFKGLALARYYPARAARETGDVDLLVAPEELCGAEEVLRAAGYEHWAGGGGLSASYAVTFGRYGDHGEEQTVDLHPAWHEVAVGAAGIEVAVGESREPVAAGDVAGTRWNLLPPSVELYLTAAHAVLHGNRTLSVYLDLAVQLAAAGESTVAATTQLARFQGRDRHLKHALTAAAELFGLDLDPGHVTTLRRLGVPVGVRLGYAGAGFRLVPSSLVMELALRRGLRRKLAFLRWVVGHRGAAAVKANGRHSVGRLRRAVRGFRWLKGRVLRYRVLGSVPLRP
ncbi:MAG: nucleotidyltransferase family protein [Gemmatimonadota bacterium]|nr:MAG: nucleotidyltransferase family protein [Gemmatimonadota bacterium]